MSLVDSPGILLRSHEYSESSHILRFLTPAFGVVSVIARGTRRHAARGEDRPQSFGEGVLTFAYRTDRDLFTLRNFRSRTEPFAPTQGYLRLAGASVIAEVLLVHSLQATDEDLYEWIRTTFEAIGHGPGEALRGAILAGAWGTLSRLGFPPELERCIRCGRTLEEPADESGETELDRFDVAEGGILCAECGGDATMPRIGPEAKRQLVSLVAGIVPSTLRREHAHLLLLERFAHHHLSSRRKFRTFDALGPLFQQMEQER